MRVLCEVCLKGVLVGDIKQDTLFISPCPVCFPAETQKGTPVTQISQSAVVCAKSGTPLIKDDVPFPNFYGEDTIFIEPCSVCFPDAFRVK